MTDEDRARLRAIGRHAEILASPGFSFGAWVPSRTDENGVIQVGWYEPSLEAEAFLTDARAIVRAFDWSAWAAGPEGRALLGHPEAVATASADDLRRLLTTYLRSERFGDGTLENAHASGMLTAIARRAAALGGEGER